MFLKAEPTCAHHDNVSIKANIIEIDAGCVWNTEPSELSPRNFSEQESSIRDYYNMFLKAEPTCAHHDNVSLTSSSKLMQVVCGIQDLLKSKNFSEQESSLRIATCS